MDLYIRSPHVIQYSTIIVRKTNIIIYTAKEIQKTFKILFKIYIYKLKKNIELNCDYHMKNNYINRNFDEL